MRTTLFAGTLLLAFAANAHAQTPECQCSLDDFKPILSDHRVIHSPKGIETLEKVTLGGVEQWISIRGRSTDNPVILFIHGGPGDTMMPKAWAFQNPWEDFFTIVHWDQRGFGKSAREATADQLLTTMTVTQLVEDAEELTTYLQAKLRKPKVILMAHSFGTRIAADLVRKRPDLFVAYVPVGQVVGPEGERMNYEQTLSLARQARDTVAVRELLKIAPYPVQPVALQKMLTLRKWSRVYNGGWYGKRTVGPYLSLAFLGTEYDILDREAAARNAGALSAALLPIFGEDIAAAGTEFKLPIVMFMGKHDLHTNFTAARNYYDSISAPHKQFVTFEMSGHFPMLEEPGRFLLALVNHVLPLAAQ